MCVSPNEMTNQLLTERVQQLRRWAEARRSSGHVNLADQFEWRADMYVKILNERAEEGVYVDA